MEERKLLADKMVDILRTSPERVEEFKKDPTAELKKLIKDAMKLTPAYLGDKWLYRVAIIVLGLLALMTSVGSIILVLGNQNTPEVLIALGSAAVGAIVGLFARSPVDK